MLGTYKLLVIALIIYLGKTYGDESSKKISEFLIELHAFIEITPSNCLARLAPMK